MDTETNPIEITPHESVVPVFMVPLAQEDVDARAAAEAEQAALADQLLAAAASARSKLLALGLTDEEITAMSVAPSPVVD